MEIELPLSVVFRGHEVGSFEPDLIVERGGVGLLVNFGRRPEFKRYVMGDPHNSLPKLSKIPVKHIDRGTRAPDAIQAAPSRPG